MSDLPFELDDRGALSAKAIDALRQRFVAKVKADAKKIAKRAAKQRVEALVEEQGADDKPAAVKAMLASEHHQTKQAEDAELLERYLTKAANNWVRWDERVLVQAANNNRLKDEIDGIKDSMPKHQKAKYAGYTGERGWGSFMATAVRSPFNVPRMIREKHFRQRDLHTHVFGEREDRIYVPLVEGYVSGTQKRVEARLQQLGYSDVDYIGGYAKDDRKNTVKIGKILTKSGDERLMEEYNRDGARQRDKNIVVFSRHPEDIARCSTGRAWSSCMDANTNWNFDPYVLRDIKEGTLVAYLIKDSDPEIRDPLARILIKPMKNKKGELAWQPEGLPYGLYSDIFKETVAEFTDQAINRGRVGEFTFINGLYRDSIRTNVTRTGLTDPGLTAEDVLNRLKVSYKKGDDGTLVVHGDLDLSKQGLKQLPDMTRVMVMGDLDLRHNKLTTLTGAPQAVSGALLIGGNMLENLEGSPEVVGELQAQDCNLTSLKGAPKTVNGKFNVSQNPLTSLADGPEQVKGEYNASQTQVQTLDGLNTRGIRLLNLRNGQVVSLVGMPDDVKTLDATNNQIKSAAGLPGESMASIDLSHNPLETMEGFPKEVKGKVVLRGTRLTDLSGTLERCTDTIDLDGVKTLTSLTGGVKTVRHLQVSNTGLKDFVGVPERARTITATDIPGLKLNGLTEFQGELEITGMKLDARTQSVNSIMRDLDNGASAQAELAQLKAAIRSEGTMVTTGFTGPAMNEDQDNNPDADKAAEVTPKAAGGM